MDELNWNGMEGINYENDKYSLEENVLNGRLEIWPRYMQKIDGKMKKLIMEMIWRKWLEEGIWLD